MFLRRFVLSLSAIALFAPLSLSAQSKTPSDFEIFGGYSWYHPGGSVPLAPVGLPTISPAASVGPDIGIGDFQKGWGGALTINVNNWLGITADGSGHYEDGDAYTIAGGPRFKMHRGRLEPFAEVLVGLSHWVPDALPEENHFALITGLGLDYRLNRNFAIRPIQVDYVFTSYNAINPKSWNSLNGVRVQAGFVFNLGFHQPEAPPTAGCSAEPSTVDAGGPVTVTVAPSGFPPDRTLSYSYMSTGGKVSGNTSTTSVDTTGLQAGSYTVSATVTDNGSGKRQRTASCQTTFMVKEPPPKNPPNISCMAEPSAVTIGDSSAIHCTCSSPDNVPVTIGAFTASGGSVSGSGGTGTLDTNGVSAGTITVSATCSDSRGLNTSAMVPVTVASPPPAVKAEAPAVSPRIQEIETRLALHSIYFPTAQPTAENPNGGLLASQEQTLVPLASDFKEYLEAKPDAHLILEGHTDPRGSEEYNQALSERRVARVKQSLIEHGVPAANIETKGFGKQEPLTEAQVKEAVENSPELTPEQRQKELNNLTIIRLANDRRVDVTLSTTGQHSVRQYPFNAADSMTLLSPKAANKTTRGVTKKKQHSAQ